MNQKQLEEYVHTLVNKDEVLDIKMTEYTMEHNSHRFGGETPKIKIGFVGRLTKGGIARFNIECDSLSLNAGARTTDLIEKVKATKARKIKERDEKIDFKKELKGL